MKIVNFSKPKNALRFLGRKPPPPPIAVPLFSTGAMPMAMATPRALIEEEVQPPAPVVRRIKKRALLIGIQLVREKPADVLSPISPLSPRIVANVDAGIQKVKTKYRAKKRARAMRKNGLLKGPHRDVAAMKDLLINVYKYEPEDIVVLIDDDESGHKQPTKENIMDEMRKLVAGAEENDRFFFHFSGHSTQEDTDDIEEEDRKNEFIMTSDGDSIKDDVLKATLVDPLPPKSSLIAVFDSCHSGSLLDLKHFRCNRVYVPWLNRGRRRTASMWQFTQRRRARISPTQSPLRRLANIPGWAKSSIDNVMDSPKTSLPPVHENASMHENHDPLTVNVSMQLPDRFSHKSTARSSLSIVTDVHKPRQWLLETQCNSPVDLYCTGFCRENPANMEDGIARPDVISISSAKDSQLSWEDGDGASTLTQSLVRILNKDPHPTFHDLLTIVSHDIHSYYIDLHSRAREYRKKVRLANFEKMKKGEKPRPGKEVEMNNFQNPQLSSEKPLDMARHFYP